MLLIQFKSIDDLKDLDVLKDTDVLEEFNFLRILMRMSNRNYNKNNEKDSG